MSSFLDRGFDHCPLQNQSSTISISLTWSWEDTYGNSGPGVLVLKLSEVLKAISHFREHCCVAVGLMFPGA